MKKWCLFLSLYFCICLLAACAGGDVSAGAGADSGGTPAEETRTGGETTEPGRVTETFRLVTVGDGDDPASVLAGTDGGAGAVYTLDLFSVEDLTIEGYTRGDGPAGLVSHAWRSGGGHLGRLRHGVLPHAVRHGGLRSHPGGRL